MSIDEDRFAAAMEEALANGKGWSSDAERQAYIDKVTDDEFLPAIFCSTPEELANAPDGASFQALLYDNQTAASNMVEKKDLGNEKLRLGRQNEARNFQYYRDAVNAYTEAIGWAGQIVCTDDESYEPAVDGDAQKHDKHRLFTRQELAEYTSILHGNRAMSHMEIKNWGFAIADCKASIEQHKENLKSHYRLAKCHETRREYELALAACEQGLEVDPSSVALQKILRAVNKEGQRERKARQTKERERVQRAGKIKAVYKWCKDKSIKLGRVPLVSTVDEEDEDDDEYGEKENSAKRWNHIQPFFGKMPEITSLMEYSWPTMFLYPSHNQSDFIPTFGGDEMIALRLAEMFPEEEDSQPVAWDYNHQFKCSNLALYFEVNGAPSDGVCHPESVLRLDDMSGTMRFFENARALKGVDGQAALEKARDEERMKLKVSRYMWQRTKGKHALPPVADVVQIHPACTLEQVLLDPKMIVPNLVLQIMVFPVDHDAHKEFLKERKIVGVINPVINE
jgi:tetratricopeptide (TPR) repeat protein